MTWRIVFVSLVFSGVAQAALAADVPTYDAVRNSYRPSDRTLLDRQGRALHEVRTDPSRRRFDWVALEDVSPALLDAVISSEDRRFFSHGGVDFKAALSAAAGWIIGNARRGASTVSMQLVALLDDDLRRGARPRTVWSKWQQMQAAWRLEEGWTKRQILEAYLNLVTFRGEVQGVGAASAVLFGKSPHALTRAEAAVMAALIRSPNASSGAAASRVRSSLPAQDIPLSEIEEAVARATGNRADAPEHAAAAPHVARRLLPRGSVADRIESTLDLDVQRVATAALRSNLLALRDRGVRDGAVLVVDNETGDVLAYVGSSGDLSAAPQVDGVQARRQPGSALKPFLYSLAIEQRILTAASLIDDAPLEIAVATGLYRPENYDGHFRGLVSLRTALASSLNIPAVRTLQLIGDDTFVDHLRDLGFAGLTRPAGYYGPALALGGAEVSLWEIVNAYRTIANGGLSGTLRLVADKKTVAPRRIYSEQTAFVTSSILSDRDGRSVTFGLESALATPFWTAVKTGTSKDMRDNWCVGFSRRYTAGVWVGNFSGYPMGDVSGVSGAPVWLEVMQWLHRDEASAEPPPPAGLALHEMRFATTTEAPRSEWFLADALPNADQSLAPHRSRILVPTDSTIIALDPEIPTAHQRVAFEASSSDDAATWVLDGAPLGPAAQRILWSPMPGLHRLLLVDDAGRPVDQVSFRVRGNT